MMAVEEIEDWQCGKTLPESIEYMYTSSTASDVTFFVGKFADKVLAHKFILISRSSVFQTMLADPSASEGVIKLPDIPRDIFLLFLRYIYTDSVELTVHNVKSVLQVAEKFKFERLKKTCGDFMEKNVIA